MLSAPSVGSSLTTGGGAPSLARLTFLTPFAFGAAFGFAFDFVARFFGFAFGFSYHLHHQTRLVRRVLALHVFSGRSSCTRRQVGPAMQQEPPTHLPHLTQPLPPPYCEKSRRNQWHAVWVLVLVEGLPEEKLLWHGSVT